jgi:plasmid stabilization system protein ParE
MNRRINWTAESERTFNQNLDYLTKEWDAVVLNSFFDRVDEVLELIRSNPELYPLHRPEENVHRCVVHERIMLYYRIVDDHTIDLLTFWNTTQDPDKLKL